MLAFGKFAPPTPTQHQQQQHIGNGRTQRATPQTTQPYRSSENRFTLIDRDSSAVDTVQQQEGTRRNTHAVWQHISMLLLSQCLSDSVHERERAAYCCLMRVANTDFKPSHESTCIGDHWMRLATVILPIRFLWPAARYYRSSGRESGRISGSLPLDYLLTHTHSLTHTMAMAMEVVTRGVQTRLCQAHHHEYRGTHTSGALS